MFESWVELGISQRTWGIWHKISLKDTKIRIPSKEPKILDILMICSEFWIQRTILRRCQRSLSQIGETNLYSFLSSQFLFLSDSEGIEQTVLGCELCLEFVPHNSNSCRLFVCVVFSVWTCWLLSLQVSACCSLRFVCERCWQWGNMVRTNHVKGLRFLHISLSDPMVLTSRECDWLYHPPYIVSLLSEFVCCD